MIIRNIWAIGRNFKEHAAEMNAPIPDRPLVFLKAGSSATVGSTEIWLPSWTEEVNFELELALRFDNFLRMKEAALALDLTERKQQLHAKNAGQPWTLAKSFDEACPITPPFLFSSLDAIRKKPYRLWVNDELKQETSADQMIFSLEQCVEHVEEYFPVCGGDFLLTGTPAGVGPLKAGDKVKVQMEGEITHFWTVFQHEKAQDDKE